MMEKMSPGAKVSETSDLIIHDTEQDIAVKLDKISPRWSLQGDRTEVGDHNFCLLQQCLLHLSLIEQCFTSSISQCIKYNTRWLNYQGVVCLLHLNR